MKECSWKTELKMGDTINNDLGNMDYETVTWDWRILMRNGGFIVTTGVKPPGSATTLPVLYFCVYVLFLLIIVLTNLFSCVIIETNKLLYKLVTQQTISYSY